MQYIPNAIKQAMPVLWNFVSNIQLLYNYCYIMKNAKGEWQAVYNFESNLWF